ncbi:hypothetical protein JCM14244_03660 [Venenivibrio stagnispumantis]|uniref:Outer membrane protein OmpA n=1 Tax=Venenivibrio stagnispumantis TaxID=407998 RepID=A0AA45WMA5_9AQUI|nr:OmpA family protein [Venenivibrio stagnispumantis]MCW4572786.1 OmpA family protein [Venenivibrio stagnispumantis]SMP13850.1 Outer membrane protein OmpA [Venenivibrio stagnispumantis]
MKKIFMLSLLSVSFAFAQVKDIKTIEYEIEKIKELHAKECAPDELGKAESYFDKLKEVNPKNEIDLNNLKAVEYLRKTEQSITLAKAKIYSDNDKDGVPCYQEIARGTNPEVPDIEKKVAKEEAKPKEEIKPQEEIKPKEETTKKENVEPLLTQARIHFQFNKASIKKEYLPYLNIIVKKLKEDNSKKVKIIGYTDNIGSKDYNDKLAKKRAMAIKNYLVKKGISPDRIIIEGKGKSDYLVSNDNEINRFTNRRADFFIVNIE